MVARILLPIAFAVVPLAACGGGAREQDTASASADSAARAADSVARAARTGPQRLGIVMIGKRLGAGNRIAEPTFQFTPADTVYVSAEVQGAPAEGSLSARWLARSGKTLDSTAVQLTPADTGIKEFHLAPAKGWQPGTYLVTLYLNGDSADAKTFSVQK